jgi:hypothetical protein
VDSRSGDIKQNESLREESVTILKEINKLYGMKAKIPIWT